MARPPERSDRPIIPDYSAGPETITAPSRGLLGLARPADRCKATGECKPTPPGSIPPDPMMGESRWTDHRLSVRVGDTHGRLGRTPRRTDPLRGQATHRIPTPLIPGRGRGRTLLGQRPPGRAPLRLGP